MKRPILNDCKCGENPKLVMFDYQKKRERWPFIGVIICKNCKRFVSICQTANRENEENIIKEINKWNDKDAEIITFSGTIDSLSQTEKEQWEAEHK